MTISSSRPDFRTAWDSFFGLLPIFGGFGNLWETYKPSVNGEMPHKTCLLGATGHNNAGAFASLDLFGCQWSLRKPRHLPTI